MWHRISIVQRVYFGFLTIVALMILTAWLSFSQSRQASYQLDDLSSQAMPVMLKASQMSKVLLNIENLLNRTLVETELAALVSLKDELTGVEQDFTAHFSDLLRQLGEQSNSVEIERELAFLSGDFFVRFKDLINDQQKYFAEQELIQTNQGRYQLSTAKLKRMIYALAADSDDMNVSMTAESLGSGIDALSFNTDKALQSTEVEAITQLIKKNVSLVKKLASTAQQLKKNTRKFNARYQNRLQDLIKNASQESGVLALHLSMEKQRDDTGKELEQLRLKILHGLKVVDSFNLSNMEQVKRDVEKASKDQRLHTSEVFAVSLFATLLATFLAVAVASAIKRPLRELLNALQQLSEGNLSGSMQQAMGGEFGLLAKRVEQVQRSQVQLLTQLDNASKKLTQISVENTQSTNEARDSLDLQLQLTESVATAMLEMEQTTTDVARATHHSLESVSEVESMSNRGQVLMAQNIETHELLKTRLEQTNQAIDTVRGDAKRIETVLEVIQGIAAQTNLLALNAAIEAARAGERGRGFAVVADEVRNLAMQTSQSTTSIQSTIDRLQDGVSLAVSRVTACAAEMDNSLECAKQANDSMSNIQQQVQSVTEIAGQISVSAEQQKVTTQEVATNLTHIRDRSESNHHSLTLIAKNSRDIEDVVVEQDNLVTQYQFIRAR